MTPPARCSRPASGGEKLMRWDLFCRVVDNLGDAAVMWRLARQLAVEHCRHVRLFVDRPEVLRRLVPAARVGVVVDGVAIHSLATGDRGTGDGATDDGATGHGTADNGEAGDREAGTAVTPSCDADVVVAGFHAALPPPYRQCMRTRRPVWINLEYLSAEDWIEGFHRRPCPHADGLTEWFFYPGFTAASGGLLRESDLIDRRDAFHRNGCADAFLAGLGVHRQPGEAVASLLCYPDAPLALLARRLADASARLRLLVARDTVATRPDDAELMAASRGRLRITRIPFLPQREYDPLLWSCDFNFVRGEDSLVRAVWSGKPFVWNIYPQAQEAHRPKLEAFLRLLPGQPVAEAIRWWNRLPGAADASMLEFIEHPGRGVNSLPLLSELTRTKDLATRLLEFVAEHAARPDHDRRMTGKL